MKRERLTSLQQSMVLASMRAPQSGAYVIQEICVTPEQLDLEDVRIAWASMANRHEALRTSIETDADGTIWQKVNAPAEISCRELDWTSVTDEERQWKLEAWLRYDRERGLDFRNGVPARVTLIRMAESSTLIWTSHHVLLDARSYLIAWREWFSFLDARTGAGAVRLAEPPQFSAHLEWLRRQDWTRARQYWQRNLAGMGETSGCVADRLSHSLPNRDEGSGRASERMTAELTQALESFAQAQGVTVNTLVQAAWALLLSRYGGRQEVVFGVTRAGRRSGAPDVEGAIGLFINTLPLRVATPPDAQLEPWLREIRSNWDAMREFEHTPLDVIRECSGFPPGQPLFDTVLNFDREPAGETLRKLGGAWLMRKFTRRQRTDSALTLAVYSRPVLSFDIVYDSRLFGPQMMAAMAGHLRQLLQSFLAQPGRRLAELKMLTAGEERRLYRSRAQALDGSDCCIHELVERQAGRLPEQTALDAPGGTLTYRRLNEQANQMARRLRERGAAPEERVAVCLDRSPQAVISILAVLKAGAAFVPFEPGLPPERLAQMLETACPRFVIAGDAGLPSAPCEVLSIDRLFEEMASQPATDLAPLATPENAAYCIFTSGSTGTPKGVVVTHRSLVNYTLSASAVYGISETDRRLQFASIGTDVFVAEVFNYLSRGAALVFGLPRQGTSAGDFLRFLQQQRITITGISSSWWTELVAALSDGRIQMPSSLRALIAGMERVDPSVYRSWMRVAAGRVRWFNAYGPTEATATATIYEGGTSEWESESAVPIGTPLANTAAYVLDSAMSQLPAGVVGELYIGGAGVARGYLNAPELTAARFIPDPFNSEGHGRLYRTGDLAYFLPDGNLVFVGRKDRQVKIRGHRVELEEIEAALASHPAIRQCAVIVENRGRQERLIAHLTTGGPAPDRDSLLAHLSRRLPDHMLPAAFVTRTEMPLTPSGKLDRQALAESEPAQLTPEDLYCEPQGPVESRLAALWAELFGLPRVGSTDNFFELGGDSLTATRLITAIHGAFGRELDLADLIQAPTVSRLAARVQQDLPAASRDVLPIQPSGERTPFFCVSDSLLYFDLAWKLGPDQPFYSIRTPDWTTLAEPLSLEAIASRYVDCLREFQPHGPYLLGGWCQSGIIAYEMAQQLRGRGEAVPLVVLFDAFPPQAARQWSWAAIFAKLRFHFGVLRRLAGGERLAYIAERVRTLRYSMRGGYWRISSRVALALGAAPAPQRANRERAQFLSFIHYSPRPYAGRILLLRALDQPDRIFRERDSGFRALAPGLEIVDIPGDHEAMFKDPAVSLVARELANRFSETFGAPMQGLHGEHVGHGTGTAPR